MSRAASRRAGSTAGRGGLRFWLPLVIAWALPLLGLGVFVYVGQAQDAEAAAPARVDVVTVGERSQTFPAAVTVHLTMPPASELTTGAGGIVTAVKVEPDQQPRDGAVAFEVSGRPVYFHVGDLPFYRTIASGTRGADVVELRAFLAARGMSVAARGEAVDSTLRDAICAFNRGTGADCDAPFDPAHVVFVPSGTAAIEKVDLIVGKRVEPGATVATAQANPTAVRFVPQDERTTLTELSDRPLALTAAGKSLDISGLEPAGAELAAIRTFIAQGAAAGHLTVTPTDTGIEAGGALLKLRSPTRSGVVPASALRVAEDGTTCVVRVPADATPPDLRPADLTPAVVTHAAAAPGEIGVVMVDEALIGATILRDPSAAPASRSAPCG